MNDKNLYQQTFSKFHASDRVVEEILAMNQQKTRRRLRPLWAAALCVCVLAGGALTANAATGGTLFKSITWSGSVSEAEAQGIVVTFQDDGNVLKGKDGATSAETMKGLESGEDGYLFGKGVEFYLTDAGEPRLRMEGQAEKELAEILQKDGAYTFTFEENGKTVSAGVELKPTPDGNGYYLYSSDGTEKREGFIGTMNGYGEALAEGGAPAAEAPRAAAVEPKQ